jgi:hypothetical protein
MLSQSTQDMMSAGIRFAWNGFGGVALVVCLVALAIFIAIRAYRDTEPALARGRQTLLSSLRAISLFLIIAMLAEPVLHRRETLDLPPSVLLLVDDSASMGIRSNNGEERLDSADRLRRRLASVLAERDTEQITWMGQGARRIVSSRRAEADAIAAGRRLREGTDLPALLLSATQRHLEDNLRAIVLLSDGVSTVESSPSLAGLDLPVFTVATGDTIAPVDLRIDHVRYPSLVQRGERVEIQAELAGNLSEAGSVTLHLEQGGTVIDSLSVDLPAGVGRREVRFEVQPDSLGLRTYTLRVPAREGEALLENNSAIAGMQVRKERLRIAFVEARPTWNFHFIARSVRRDPRFEFFGIHRNATGWAVAGKDSTWSLPTSAEDLESVDLWIAASLDDLGELLGAQAPVDVAVASGAGLLVLAGDPNRRLMNPQLRGAAALLPASPDRSTRWQLGRNRVSVTVAGRAHPIMATDVDR